MTFHYSFPMLTDFLSTPFLAEISMNIWFAQSCLLTKQKEEKSSRKRIWVNNQKILESKESMLQSVIVSSLFLFSKCYNMSVFLQPTVAANIGFGICVGHNELFWLFCIMVKQYAGISRRLAGEDSTSCHTEIEVADQICYITQSHTHWHQAHQSWCWPYNARRLAGLPIAYTFLIHWYYSTKESVGQSPDLPFSWQIPSHFELRGIIKQKQRSPSQWYMPWTLRNSGLTFRSTFGFTSLCCWLSFILLVAFITSHLFPDVCMHLLLCGLWENCHFVPYPDGNWLFSQGSCW